MSKATNAVLQYLGLLILAVGVWVQFFGGGAKLGIDRLPTILWIFGGALLLAGTVLRFGARQVERRPLVKPRFEAPPVEDDLSRAITPAMLDELERSARWISGFAFFAGVGAVLAILGGVLTMFSGMSEGTRLSLVLGFGIGLSQILIGSMELMLFSYVRDHRKAIDAAGDRLTETKFITIVDTQRRIWRFFGAMLSFVGALAVVFIIAGVAAAVVGLLR